MTLTNKDDDKDFPRVGRIIYRLILFGAVAVGALVAGIAIVQIIYGFIGYIRTTTFYNATSREFVEVVYSDDFVPVSASSNEVSENKVDKRGKFLDNKDTLSSNSIRVNLDGMRAINDEVKGWIYFEDGLISYPILQGPDNDKYLRKSYKGTYLGSGSIFLDYRSDPEMDDRHALIYGHNMKNLTMFGKLRYYRTKEGYYKDHQYFQIITPDYTYRYKIFSCKLISSESDLYTILGPDSDELTGFVSTYLTGSNYVRDETEIKPDDHVVTLSTCVNDDAYRLIVSGVRIEERKNRDRDKERDKENMVYDVDIDL